VQCRVLAPTGSLAPLVLIAIAVTSIVAVDMM
jgi:hypothetical protein